MKISRVDSCGSWKNAGNNASGLSELTKIHPIAAKTPKTRKETKESAAVGSGVVAHAGQLGDSQITLSKPTF